MRVAVLGTGMVGRAHAARLTELGHDVVLGTRDAARLLAGSPDDDFGRWRAQHRGPAVAAYADALAAPDVVINALNGSVAVPVLSSHADALDGVVLIDVTNPLDFSSGQLELFVCNTDSLGEQIQRVLPTARVVKTLCTVTADVQVDASVLADDATDMFIAGNDADAKRVAGELARSYGWTRMIDLGDITGSRAMEMLLPMWVRLYQALGTPMFNYRVITGRD